MTQTLSLERFRALVEAYGARPEVWPASEREAALSLCAASPEARALVAAESLLDAELAAGAPPELDPDFLRRLNEVPLRVPQHARWSLRHWLVPSLSWAFAAVVGLGIGLTSDPWDEPADVSAAVASADSATPSASNAAPVLDDDQSALAGGALIELEE